MSRPASPPPFGATAVFFVWLVLLWVLLWGGFTLANVVGGAVVAGLLLALVPRAGAPANDAPRLRPLAMASLLVWFLAKLVEANLRVALEVMRPPGRTRLRPAIVSIALPGCPDGITTAVANSITLTPGTLTVEVDPEGPVLFVHVMQFESVETTRQEVYEIERRIVAAVGSAEARAAVASGRGPQPAEVPEEGEPR
jgi:multicomponent Na+:H+ antiporter subunit E